MSPLALDLEPNVSSTATKRANSASSNLSMICLGPGGARSTNYFVLMLKLIGILSHACKGESNYMPGSDSFLYAGSAPEFSQLFAAACLPRLTYLFE
jgi:hypothetical protein